MLWVHGAVQAGVPQVALHHLPVLVPPVVPFPGHQCGDVVLGVVPISIGPVVGVDPRNKEAMVFLLGPSEVLLSPLSGGFYQLIPGQQPAYKELVNHVVN